MMFESEVPVGALCSWSAVKVSGCEIHPQVSTDN